MASAAGVSRAAAGTALRNEGRAPFVTPLMELSVAQAAALVGRSPRAVRAWIASGRLAARKTERGWFVRSEELPLTEA